MVLPVSADSEEAAVQSLRSQSSSPSPSELHSCCSSPNEEFFSDSDNEIGSCCTQKEKLFLKLVSQNVDAQTCTEKLEERQNVASRISSTENSISNEALSPVILSAQECQQGCNKQYVCNTNPNSPSSKSPKSPTTLDIQHPVIVQSQPRSKNFSSDQAGCLNWWQQGSVSFPGVRHKTTNSQSCHNNPQVETVPYCRASSGKGYAKTRPRSTTEQPAMVFCDYSMQASTIYHWPSCSLQQISPYHIKTRSRSCPLLCSQSTKFNDLQDTTKSDSQPYGNADSTRYARSGVQNAIKCNGTQKKASGHESYSRKQTRDDWRPRIVVGRLNGENKQAVNKAESGKTKQHKHINSLREKKRQDSNNSVWNTNKDTIKDKEYFESLLKLLKWKTEFVNSSALPSGSDKPFMSSCKVPDVQCPNINYCTRSAIKGKEAPHYVAKSAPCQMLKTKHFKTRHSSYNTEISADYFVPDINIQHVVDPKHCNSMSGSVEKNYFKSLNLSVRDMKVKYNQVLNKEITQDEKNNTNALNGHGNGSKGQRQATTGTDANAFPSQCQPDRQGRDNNFIQSNPALVSCRPTYCVSKLGESYRNKQLHPSCGNCIIKKVSPAKVASNPSGNSRNSMPNLGAKALLLQTCKKLRFSKSDEVEKCTRKDSIKATIASGKIGETIAIGKEVTSSNEKQKIRRTSVWKSMPQLDGCKKSHQMLEKLSPAYQHRKSMPQSLDEIAKATARVAVIDCLQAVEGTNHETFHPQLSEHCVEDTDKHFRIASVDGQSDDSSGDKVDRVKTYTLLSRTCQEELSDVLSSSILDDNSNTALVNDRSREKVVTCMPKTFMTKMRAKKILANLITSSPANVLRAEFIREMIIRNWMMRRMQSGADYATVTRTRHPVPDICADYVYRTQAYGCGDKGLMTYHRPVVPNASAPRRFGSDEVTTCCGLGRRPKRESVQEDYEEQPVKLKPSRQVQEHSSITQPVVNRSRQRLYSPAPPNPFTITDSYEPHVGLKPYDIEDVDDEVPHPSIPQLPGTKDHHKSVVSPEEEYWGDWEEEPCDDNDFDDAASVMEVPELLESLPKQYSEEKDVKENWSWPPPAEPDAPLMSSTDECPCLAHELSSWQKQPSPPVKESSFTKPDTVCYCYNRDTEKLISCANLESSLGFLSINTPKRSFTEECLTLVRSQCPDKEVQTISLPELGLCEPMFPSKIDAATTTEVLVYSVQMDEATTMNHRGLVDSETEEEGGDEETEPLSSEGEGELVETLSEETQTKPVVVLPVPLFKAKPPSDTSDVNNTMKPVFTDAGTSTDVLEAFDVGTATSKMRCFEIGVDAQTVCSDATTDTQLACIAAATETCFKKDASTEPSTLVELPFKEDLHPSQIVVCSGRVPPPVCNNKHVLMECTCEKASDPTEQVVCCSSLHPPMYLSDQCHKFLTLEHVCPLPQPPCSSPNSSSVPQSGSNSSCSSPRPVLRNCLPPTVPDDAQFFQQSLNFAHYSPYTTPQQDRFSPVHYEMTQNKPTCSLCFPDRLQDAPASPIPYETQQKNELSTHFGQGKSPSQCLVSHAYELKQKPYMCLNHSSLPQCACFSPCPGQDENQNACISPHSVNVGQYNPLSTHFCELLSSNSYSSHGSPDKMTPYFSNQQYNRPQSNAAACHATCCPSPRSFEMPCNLSPQSTNRPNHSVNEISHSSNLYTSIKQAHEMPESSHYNGCALANEVLLQRTGRQLWSEATGIPDPSYAQFPRLEQRAIPIADKKKKLLCSSPVSNIQESFQTVSGQQLAGFSNALSPRNPSSKLCGERMKNASEMHCQHDAALMQCYPMGEAETEKHKCQVNQTIQSDAPHHHYVSHRKQQTDPDVTSPCCHQTQQTETLIQEESITHKCCSLQGDEFVRKMTPLVQRTALQQYKITGYCSPPPQRKKFPQKHRVSATIKPVPTSHSLPEESRTHPMSHYLSEQRSDSDADLSGSASEPALGRDLDSISDCKNFTRVSLGAEKLCVSTGNSCIWPDKMIAGRQLSQHSSRLSPQGGRQSPCLSPRSSRLYHGGNHVSSAASSDRTLTPIFEEAEPMTADKLQHSLQPTRDVSGQNVLQWLQRNRSHLSPSESSSDKRQEGRQSTYVQPTDVSKFIQTNSITLQGSKTLHCKTRCFQNESPSPSSTISTPTQTGNQLKNNQCSLCSVGKSDSLEWLQPYDCTKPCGHFPQEVDKNNDWVCSGNMNPCWCTCNTIQSKCFTPPVFTATPYPDSQMCFCSTCQNVRDEARHNLPERHKPLHSNLSEFGRANCGASYFSETTCRDADSRALYLQAGGCSSRYSHPHEQCQQNLRINCNQSCSQNDGYLPPGVELHRSSPIQIPASPTHKQQTPIFYVTSHGLSEESPSNFQRLSPVWQQQPQVDYDSENFPTNNNLSNGSNHNQVGASGCSCPSCKCCTLLLNRTNDYTLPRPATTVRQSSLPSPQSPPCDKTQEPANHLHMLTPNDYQYQSSPVTIHCYPLSVTGQAAESSVPYQQNFLETNRLPSINPRSFSSHSKPVSNLRCEIHSPNGIIRSSNVCCLQGMQQGFQEVENCSKINNYCNRPNMVVCADVNCSGNPNSYFRPNMPLRNEQRRLQSCVGSDLVTLDYGPPKHEEQNSINVPRVVRFQMPSPKNLGICQGQLMQVDVDERSTPKSEAEAYVECTHHNDGQSNPMVQHCRGRSSDDHKTRFSHDVSGMLSYELVPKPTRCGINRLNRVVQEYTEGIDKHDSTCMAYVQQSKDCCSPAKGVIGNYDDCTSSPVQHIDRYYEADATRVDGRCQPNPPNVGSEYYSGICRSSPDCNNPPQIECCCSCPMKHVIQQYADSLPTDGRECYASGHEQNYKLNGQNIKQKLCSECQHACTYYRSSPTTCMAHLHDEDVQLDTQFRVSPSKGSRCLQHIQKTNVSADDYCKARYVQCIEQIQDSRRDQCKTNRLRHKTQIKCQSKDPCEVRYLRHLRQSNNITEDILPATRHPVNAEQNFLEAPYTDPRHSTTAMKYVAVSCPPMTRNNSSNAEQTFCSDRFHADGHHGRLAPDTMEQNDSEFSNSRLNRILDATNPRVLREALCRALATENPTPEFSVDNSCREYAGKSREQKHSIEPFFNYHDLTLEDHQINNNVERLRIAANCKEKNGPSHIPDECRASISTHIASKIPGRTNVCVRPSTEAIPHMQISPREACSLQTCTESQTDPPTVDRSCSPTCGMRIEKQQLHHNCLPNNRVCTVQTNTSNSKGCCIPCTADCMAQSNDEASLPVVYRRSCTPSCKVQSSASASNPPNMTSSPKQILQINTELLKTCCKPIAVKEKQDEWVKYQILTSSVGKSAPKIVFTNSESTTEVSRCLKQEQASVHIFQPIHDTSPFTVTPCSQTISTPSPAVSRNDCGSGMVEHRCSTISPTHDCWVPCRIQEPCKHCITNCTYCNNPCLKLQTTHDKTVVALDTATGRNIMSLDYKRECLDQTRQERGTNSFSPGSNTSWQPFPVQPFTRNVMTSTYHDCAKAHHVSQINETGTSHCQCSPIRGCSQTNNRERHGSPEIFNRTDFEPPHLNLTRSRDQKEGCEMNLVNAATDALYNQDDFRAEASNQAAPLVVTTGTSSGDFSNSGQAEVGTPHSDGLPYSGISHPSPSAQQSIQPLRQQGSPRQACSPTSISVQPCAERPCTPCITGGQMLLSGRQTPYDENSCHLRLVPRSPCQEEVQCRQSIPQKLYERSPCAERPCTPCITGGQMLLSGRQTPYDDNSCHLRLVPRSPCQEEVQCRQSIPQKLYERSPSIERPWTPSTNGRQSPLSNYQTTHVEDSCHQRFVPRSPCPEEGAQRRKLLPQQMHQHVSPAIPAKYLVPSEYFKTLTSTADGASDCVMNVLSFTRSADMSVKQWGVNMSHRI